VEMLLAIGFWHLAFDQKPTANSHQYNSQRPTTFPLNPFMSRYII